MVKKLNELFVKIDNRNIEGEYALTPIEMKLYCHLYINMTHEINLTTKIAWLVDLIELKSSKQRNKKAVEEALDGLVKKGAVLIEQKGDFIIISDFESYYLEDKFTIIPYSIVRGLTDEHELKLYIAIKRFKNNVADYPASRMENILDCSDNKARNVVKSLCEKGLISMVVGSYINGTKKQESNKYSIVIFESYTPALEVKKPKKAAEKPQKLPVLPETKQMAQLPAKPVQEPVDNTVPPTLEEMLPHLDLGAFKERVNPQPQPEQTNPLLDIEALLEKELNGL